MKYRHFSTVPQAYGLEERADNRVNVWLCRQIDSYITPDGIREYDVDVRVIYGVEFTPELENDLRARWETWWKAAVELDEQREEAIACGYGSLLPS